MCFMISVAEDREEMYVRYFSTLSPCETDSEMSRSFFSAQGRLLSVAILILPSVIYLWITTWHDLTRGIISVGILLGAGELIREVSLDVGLKFTNPISWKVNVSSKTVVSSMSALTTVIAHCGSPESMIEKACPLFEVGTYSVDARKDKSGL